MKRGFYCCSVVLEVVVKVAIESCLQGSRCVTAATLRPCCLAVYPLRNSVMVAAGVVVSVSLVPPHLQSM